MAERIVTPIWRCSCGDGNVDSLQKCGGCGKDRYLSEMKPLTGLPARLTGLPALAAEKRAGNRKLRQHREPNQTERDFGLLLEARRQRGEIEYFGFEEITLRWADLEYTPDYFVIEASFDFVTEFSTMDAPPRPYIQAVYIELKGAHKWEDSIIKWKTAKERFWWARFQMHQRIGGNWEQVA
jgi:hypothetical protein